MTDQIYTDEIYPSRFWRGQDLPDEGMKARIQQVTLEDLKDYDTGGLKPKIILHLANSDKDVALNKTQAKTLGTLFGEPANTWAGKVVFMIPDVLKTGNKTIKFFKAGGNDQEPPEGPPVNLEEAPPDPEETEE